MWHGTLEGLTPPATHGEDEKKHSLRLDEPKWHPDMAKKEKGIKELQGNMPVKKGVENNVK